MVETNTPLPGKERSDILDIVRGFALLGILLANSAIFSLYIFQAPEARELMYTSPADRVLSFLIHAFVEGKFYSIFSLLFGIGFSIIFLRKTKDGKNGLAIFYRRLFVLAIFGLCHSFLVWDGDILFFYALAGMFLPLFRNASNRTLLLLVIVLLLSPLIFDFIKVITKGSWNLATPFLEKAISIDKANGIEGLYPGNWLISHSSYSDLMKWNHSGFWWGWFLRMDGNRIVKVFAMFLLGLYAGRNYIYLNLNKHKDLLRKMQKLGFAIGIPAALAYAWFEADKKSLPATEGLLDTLTYALNVAPLAIAYASTICLWYQKGRIRRVLHALKPVGRMALTNYILQSVISISIYYGIGLGLGGQFGPALYVPIAIFIFLFQMLYSNWWFRNFNYGPLEWIWRMLTYGAYLPLKKQSIT